MFYTRASVSTSMDLTKLYLLLGVTLTLGRPKVGKVLEAIADRTIALCARRERLILHE
jgi:hypothetical protein